MRLAESAGCSILTYHSIDDSGSVISTSPAIFRQQMRSLRETDHNVISFRELTVALRENAPLPVRTVCLTFDDGFQNFYTTAFPALQEHGFKATVFLVTDFCGQNNDWAGNPKDFPKSRVLSWGEVKELANHGVDFGNHTRTHPDLTRTSAEHALREVEESKRKIEDSLGCEAAGFAYPFGRSNPRLREMVGRFHESACSTDLGKVGPQSERLALERIDAFYLSNLRVFGCLSTKAFDRYLLVRQKLRVIKSVIRN